MSKTRKNSIVYIDTIADLRNTIGSSGDAVDVIGYYTASDNIGSRAYYWDALSIETDNGGTIIQVTGIVTGRWKMKYSGNINVKWFGAKLDGTDDSIYFTKADIASNGGIVYVPYTSSGFNVSGLIAISTFKFEISFNNLGSSSFTNLNGILLKSNASSQLASLYKDGLPIKSLEINATFNNTLNSEIYYDGSLVKYRTTPWDAVDFTKNGTPYTKYYVNYALGNNINDGKATGVGAFKTLDYAIVTVVAPCEIILEDNIVGYLSSGSAAKTFPSGKVKVTGKGNNGIRTIIAGMRENYDLASFAWTASGTGGAYVSTTASAKFYRAQFDYINLDEDGFPSPIIAVASIVDCQATRGTYFWDSVNLDLYVNMIDGRIPDPLNGWLYAESPYDFEIYGKTLATDIILIENIDFLSNLGTSSSGSFKYRPEIAPATANLATIAMKGCRTYGSNSNGFSFYDADVIILDDCHSRYNRIDGFNYHSYGFDATKGEFITVYEHNCTSKYSGYTGFADQPALSSSANGSTAHDSMHILRTNGDYSDCHGAVVADVNGVHSLNFNVKARLPIQVGEIITYDSCFWHDCYLNAGSYPTMWLWGCSASDNGNTGVTLISNAPQSGASVNSIHVNSWRGQTDGTVIGSVKDFDGNIV